MASVVIQSGKETGNIIAHIKSQKCSRPDGALAILGEFWIAAFQRRENCAAELVPLLPL